MDRPRRRPLASDAHGDARTPVHDLMADGGRFRFPRIPFRIFSDAVFGGGLGALVHSLFDLLARLQPAAPKSDPHLVAVRAHAEESAQLENELRFTLLVESVTEYAIFMLDPEGYVTSWNAGAQRIKGYSARDIIGQHFSRFYEEEEVRAGKCARELDVATRNGRYEDEGYRVRKDGSRFWASVVLTAMRTSSGELVGFAKVTRDMTERRTAEEERLRLARAEESIRLRDEFLAIASHELRTPLTALQLQLQSLQQRLGSIDVSARAQLTRVQRSGDRMSKLVESLLDASMLITGNFLLERAPCELRAALRQLVDELHSSAARAGCALTLNAEHAVHGVWDRMRIEQALTNLIANAIKYGAGQPVAITLRGEPERVLIEVHDHGPGIAPADLTRIFGRFERAASLRHHGGLGLGLYVAREVVEAHGGTVSARNNVDGGACFTIELPR